MESQISGTPARVKGHEVAGTENNGTFDVTMVLSGGHERGEWAAWQPYSCVINNF